MINQYLPNTVLLNNLDLAPAATRPEGFVSEFTMMDIILQQRNQLYGNDTGKVGSNRVDCPPITGSFEFAASDWLLHASRTESLFSPVFRIGEHGETRWCLEVLPTGGRAADPSNNVAIVVHNKSQHDQVAVVSIQLHQYETPGSVRGEPTLLGAEETARVTSCRRRFVADGAPADASKWKLQNFIPSAVVSNPKYGFIQNNTVIFKVGITALPNSTTYRSEATDKAISSLSILPRPQSVAADYNDTVFVPVERTLATDLVALLGGSSKSPDPYADITITSSQSRSTALYHCHKAVLAARSRTLHNKFQDPLFGMKLALKRGGRYPLEVPEVLLGHFLSYLYSDRLDQSVLAEHAMELLVPATKYEVPLLVHACTQQLIGALSLTSVTSVLQTAVVTDSQLLRKSCIAFIATHLSEVVVTEEWRKVAVDTSILQDILDMSLDPHCSMCREERSVILQWINGQKHAAVASSYSSALKRLASDYISGDDEDLEELTFVSPGVTPEKLEPTGVGTGKDTPSGPVLAPVARIQVDTESHAESRRSSSSSGGSNFSHDSLFSVDDEHIPATPEQPERSTGSAPPLQLLPGKQRERLLVRHAAQSPLPLARKRSSSAPMPKPPSGASASASTDSSEKAGLGQPENLAAEFERADTEPKHSCSSNAAEAPYTRVWSHWQG